MLENQAYQVWLDLLEPKVIKENLECRVLQALLVHQDNQVPRVSRGALVLLGQQDPQGLPVIQGLQV